MAQFGLEGRLNKLSSLLKFLWRASTYCRSFHPHFGAFIVGLDGTTIIWSGSTSLAAGATPTADVDGIYCPTQLETLLKLCAL